MTKPGGPVRLVADVREKATTVDGLDDIVEEFLVESHENLDQLDSDLVALEQDPNSRERLSSIFRTIHTIKGTSGFLAFNRLEEVTHVGENMLSRLRDGELALTPARTSVLLQMVDSVRSLLTSIEASGGEGPVDVSGVVAAITAAMASIEVSRERTLSTICSSTLVRAGVSSSSPSRSRESMFSPTCVTSSSRLKARKPLVPLIVWIVRKMLDSRSRELGSCSRATRSESSWSRFS